MPLNDGLEVRVSPIEGRGLFTTRRFKKGEIIWWAPPDSELRVEHIDVIRSWPIEEQEAFLVHASQHTETLFIAPLADRPVPNEYFYNHSCDPTTWWEPGTQVLVARRDLEIGEEITYDYATSESGDETLVCRCGSPICRKFITPTDYRLPELQEKYGDHFLPYLNEKIRREREEAEARRAAGLPDVYESAGSTPPSVEARVIPPPARKPLSEIDLSHRTAPAKVKKLIITGAKPTQTPTETLPQMSAKHSAETAPAACC